METEKAKAILSRRLRDLLAKNLKRRGDIAAKSLESLQLINFGS